jgi:hypothetical protein
VLKARFKVLKELLVPKVLKVKLVRRVLFRERVV